MSQRNYKVLLTSGDLIKINRLISLTRFGGFAQDLKEMGEMGEMREMGEMGEIV